MVHRPIGFDRRIVSKTRIVQSRCRNCHMVIGASPNLRILGTLEKKHKCRAISLDAPKLQDDGPPSQMTRRKPLM